MLRPVRPSAPIRAKYHARVDAMIVEMHRSIVHWVSAEWRRADPQTVIYGEDESPVSALQAAMNLVAKRWLRRFDALSDSLAKHFAQSVRDRCDKALAADLRRGGLSVRFRMSPAMKDAFDAVRAENVSLIRSIAEQHLGKVEQLVMQSVSQGRDLAALTKGLEKTCGVTRRRAAFIARDQNNKATAAMARARHLELGVTKAKWMHSSGGRDPRPAHKAFSGQVYDIAEGHDFGDGLGRVQPGEAFNCRCFAVPILEGFGS